jgi:perosamine synthetase
MALRAKHLTTTARVAHRWSFTHDEVGYNYRMPNINAALGCAQLERLPSLLERKRKLATRYRDVFANVDGLTIMNEPAYAKSNYWLNNLILDNSTCSERDAILLATNDLGIQTRPTWELLSKLPMYRQFPRMPLSQAINLERRIVSLPSSPKLAN